MENAVHTILAGRVGGINKLNIIANNIANANTTGFRKDDLIFDKYIVNDIKDSQIFPYDVTSLTDFSSGTLSITNRSLDLAINGEGFFIIQTSEGVRYTKNGTFFINNEGVLVNTNGHSVLSADGAEIVFEDGDKNPFITSEGIVSIGNRNIGTIGMAEFANTQQLNKTDTGYFSTDFQALEAEKSNMIQGMLEGSNVNPIVETVNLINIQRQVGIQSNMINEINRMNVNAYKLISKLGSS